MESSIAEFVERQLACELLPTENVFFGLAEGFGFVNSIKLDFRVCGFWQVCWTGSTRFVFVSCKQTCSECLAKSTCKCSMRCIQCTCHLQTRCGNLHTGAYLLGLLAMIKCSICSYQCDNWYVSNWRLSCHIYFCWGSVFMSSLRSLHVLRWHSTKPVAAHPTRVTMLVRLNGGLLSIFLSFAFAPQEWLILDKTWFPGGSSLRHPCGRGNSAISDA